MMMREGQQWLISVSQLRSSQDILEPKCLNFTTLFRFLFAKPLFVPGETELLSWF